MNNFLKLFFAFAFFAAPYPAMAQDVPGAQEGGAELKLVIKSKKIELARVFHAEVELPVPAVLDKESFPADNFEILKLKPSKDSILKADITLIPFILGEAEIPALVFIDEEGRALKTAPVKVEVAKTKTKYKNKGFLDIRRPYRPFNYPRVFTFLLLAGLAAFIIYRIRRKRVVPPAAETGPYNDGKPYHIVALEQIEKLCASTLWEQGLYKEFYTKLVDIFRDYLTFRFGIEAHKYTGRDLARVLRRLPEFKGEIGLVERFQKSAALVKFAKVTPDETARDADIHNLKTVITDTRLEEAAPPQEQGNGKSL